MALGLLGPPVAIAIAILRHGLFDVELALNRTLVLIVVSALVVAAYAGAVLLPRVGRRHLGAGAAPGRRRRPGRGGRSHRRAARRRPAAVRAPARPLRRGLPRRAPHRAGRRGRRGAATAGRRVAPGPAAALGQLRRRHRPGGAPTPAVRRRGGTPSRRWRSACRWASCGPGCAVPASSSAPRRSGAMTEVAARAGTLAYAGRLVGDVAGSRARIVAAREEERRRLRDDLHDGLGPTLAGTAHQLEALATRLRRSGDDDAADRALAIRDRLRATVVDVRSIVHGLRPPVLDQRGLGGALGGLVEGIDSPVCTTDVALPTEPARGGRGGDVRDRGRGRDQRAAAQRRQHPERSPRRCATPCWCSRSTTTGRGCTSPSATDSGCAA